MVRGEAQACVCFINSCVMMITEPLEPEDIVQPRPVLPTELSNAGGVLRCAVPYGHPLSPVPCGSCG